MRGVHASPSGMDVVVHWSFEVDSHVHFGFDLSARNSVSVESSSMSLLVSPPVEVVVREAVEARAFFVIVLHPFLC